MRDLIERAKKLMMTGKFFDTKEISREAQERGLNAEKIIDQAYKELQASHPKR